VKLRKDSLVVLEGLDRAGKTTQREKLRELPWSAAPVVTHMPSGLLSSTAALYRGLEAAELRSPLAVQLAHLACHAESMPALRVARGRNGLILDRWWWSTAAYGWFGGLDLSVERTQFFGAMDLVWNHFEADVVLLFMTSFEDDSRNTSPIAEGYRWLASQNPSIAVEVPPDTPERTTAFVLKALRDRAVLIGTE
jgi:dTMP kinase